MPPVSHYIHDISPFLVRFSGSWGLRWYPIAYLLGFYLGFLLLRKLARHEHAEIPVEKTGDFISYAALFGVMLGGRLGYMLFYDWENFSRNPLTLFNTLGGGMASHGGILGLAIFSFVYARRNKLSWTGIGDDLVVIAPIGLFFGRVANFINGELYGRVADLPWAVIFPGSLYSRESNPGSDPLLWEKIREVTPELATVPPAETIPAVIGAIGTNTALRDILQKFLAPRHPSQIYEAVLEGLVLFIVLLAVRLRWKNLPHGLLTGLFFLLYAIFRIAVEQFREPDATLIMGITRGQFYSVFMIVIGLAFLGSAIVRKKSSLT